MSPRPAALVAEEALAAVVGAELVRGLRPDSPLAAVRLTAADHVALADAVRAAASSQGRSCALSDAELAHVATVGDLVTAIDLGLDGGAR